MKINVSRETIEDILRKGTLYNFNDTEEYNQCIDRIYNDNNDFVMFRHKKDNPEEIIEIKRAVIVDRLDCILVFPFRLNTFIDPGCYIDFNDIDEDLQFTFKVLLNKYL